MQIGKNIKLIREKKEMLQKEIALAAGLHASNYSKIEKGEREPTIQALSKIAKHFGMTVDEIINYENEIPNEVTIEDKTLQERVKLIQELEKDEQNMVFKFIDSLLTKKKFKDFFQKNVATL